MGRGLGSCTLRTLVSHNCGSPEAVAHISRFSAWQQPGFTILHPAGKPSPGGEVGSEVGLGEGQGQGADVHRAAVPLLLGAIVGLLRF